MSEFLYKSLWQWANDDNVVREKKKEVGVRKKAHSLEHKDGWALLNKRRGRIRRGNKLWEEMHGHVKRI